MMVSGGFGLRGLVQYTNWRRNIASVNWGMGAWSRIGLEATIIVVSSRVRKHSALSWRTTLQSVVSWHSCSPALLQGSQPWIRVVYRLR